ncbi:MAG TPA: SdpA family antimicrobial peptide system protein [Polyangiaceae bacterium]|jgi:antimicrobial peptide system SdpA family protein
MRSSIVLLPRAQRRVLGALVLALGGSFAVLGAYAVHASIEVNPISLPGEDRGTMTSVLPEGWKFFTRNPQEPQIRPYVLEGGAWVTASLLPNSRARNLLGIDRSGRAQSVELGLLSESIPSSAWIACDEAPLVCLDRAPVAATIHNDFPNASVCGAVGLVSQPPVPWAWARSSDHLDMPSRVVRVEVPC